MLKRNITVSAPGKLMLFGEHAVVYGHPCLVTTVDRRIRVDVELINDPELQLEAEDVGVTNYKKPMRELGKGEIPREVKFVEIGVKNFINSFLINYQVELLNSRHSGKRSASRIASAELINERDSGQARMTNLQLGIRITTKSEFSSKYGFGSSSGITVCVIKALAELLGENLSQKELFDLSYQTVLEVQGRGSGFDVASAIYGGTLYYVTGGKVIKPIPIKNLPLIVGYSGVKADTVTLINQVKEKADKYEEVVEGIFKEMENLVVLAANALVEGELETVGEFMNVSHGYLAALGVSNIKLENMVYAAREAGAYGAKLSGAGGGDCIIALTPEKNRMAIEKAIKKSGGDIINVNANAEGVKIEND